MSILFRIFCIIGVLGFSFTSQAYEPGNTVAVKMACKTAAAIEMVGRSARVSEEKAIAALNYQIQQGECGMFREPKSAQLVTLVSSFVDFENDTIEIWRMHNGYFAFMMDASKKAPAA
jgi:hypothetical protein